MVTAITTPLGVVFNEPDTYLAFIDPTGTSVLESSDDEGDDPGDEYGSALRYQVDTAGTYYLAVAGYTTGAQSTFNVEDIESYTPNTGSTETGRYSLLVGVNPVPEPASVAALGIGALALVRRRKAVR